MNTKIQNIVICGIGAAGSNTFLHLLYAYPAMNFTVVDFDKIENRNFEAGTQPYSKVDLNRPKTQALQRIAMTLKNKRIEAVNARLNTVKDFEPLVKDSATTLFIDAFDNAESRNLFTKFSKKCHVLHIGFSANLSGEAVWDGMFTPMTASKKDAAIDVCEMTLARPFIFALTSLAAMVISKFFDNGEKVNLYFDRHFNIKKF